MRDRTAGELIPGMAIKTKRFRLRHQEGIDPGTVAVMTGQAVPLVKGLVAALRHVVRHLIMAFQANGLGRGIEHSF